MRAIQVADWLAWRLSSRGHIDRLEVGVSDDDHRVIFRKLREAFQLIKDYDPIRYKVILGDLKRIWVRLLPGAVGSFQVERWCCSLDTRFVLTAPIETIAAAIVHEATHARLFRRKIGYCENIRHRVEAICARREIAFSAKIPNGQTTTSNAQNRLTLNAYKWSDRELARRRTRGSVEALRHLGTPEWFILAMLQFHRRQRRRRKRTT